MTTDFLETFRFGMESGREEEKMRLACTLMTEYQREAILEAYHHCADEQTINRLFANFKDVIAPEGAPKF
jgi:hypothetical protein